MKKANEYRNILNNIIASKKKTGKLNETQIGYVKCLIDNAETQKSLIAVTITSLLKKIIVPSQDIRLHRKEFKNGYSGRGLNTQVVTPWLKEYFPRFAPKESGWLTRSIEQPHPFTENFPGKIRNSKVKKAFLVILNDVEEKKYSSKSYLETIVAELLIKLAENEATAKIEKIAASDFLTIDIITEMLEKHFSKYTFNIGEEFKSGSDIKELHISEWKKILGESE